MSIHIVVATDLNGGIGKDNTLPWNLPADLQFFKNLTMGHAIVMGSKTYESIGKELPGRKNIILSRNPEISSGYSVEDLISRYKDSTDILYVIGGGEIYAAFLPHARLVHRTLVLERFKTDTKFDFPDVMRRWSLIMATMRFKDEDNPYDVQFQTFERQD